jgi:alpha-beta hydrolase superfamily lysophospholipase
MPTREPFSWTNSGGLTLRGIKWSIQQARGVVVIVHGQGEHMGRYEHVAVWFNNQGFQVVIFDQQGHGISAGVRGHAPGLASLMEDVESVVALARAAYPGIPIFLYAHSMGGNIALNVVLRRRPDIAGAVISAPWIRLAFEAPAIKVMLGYALKKFLPGLTMPNGIHARFISRDEKVVERYKSDPLVHAKISAAAGIALLEGAGWLDKYEGPIPVPLLIMHGGADRLTSMPASRAFAGRQASQVDFVEWPGLYHEIHNEPEQVEVLQAATDWLLRHCS